MSPEQLRDDVITGQSDLFSLGVVMYELLCGKHPFIAENFSRLINRILNEEPLALRDVRQDIPEVLQGIVSKAMQKDIAKRYAMGLELATDLSKAFDALEGPEENISEQEKFIAIKQLDFFQGFPEAELWEILRASTWQDYKEAEDIIIEGELDDCFYIIAEGKVSVRKNNKVIRMLAQGDCFGEMGYLAKTRRTASIKSEGKTALLKINSTVISQVSLNCQVRFLKVFLRTLINRLSITTEKASHDKV
jgi:serine/threonine protein kinase